MFSRLLCLWLGVCLSINIQAASNASNMPTDPLNSVQWVTMYHAFLKDQPVQFDSRVQILAPDSAEDSMHVPIAVHVQGLSDIEKILVFADFNPLPRVLEFYPQQAEPFIAFDLRLQQSSPVRAAVLTKHGWHVGGQWVDAAGGGCTLPSAGRIQGNWEDTLGQVYGKRWVLPTGGERVRVRIMHPMDTGLVGGIPSFYLEKLILRDAAGQPVLTVKPFEPIGENPLFSFNLPASVSRTATLQLSAVDSNGNEIEATLTP